MKLSIAEDFYSIQGEGQYIGYPALFVRLAGCNLMCGGMGTQFDGELHNDATWRCDTIEVWMKGKSQDAEEYANHLLTKYKDVLTPFSHIVITGGEPTMQQEAIVNFLNSLKKKWKFFIEVETNGTIIPSKEFDQAVDHYNISPKLGNSGNSRAIRYVPHALEWFGKNPKSSWKFVITNEADMEEAYLDYIAPHYLNSVDKNRKVWVMPSCSTQEEYNRVAPIVADFAIKYCYKFSTRLQVNIWNETTGV